MNKEELFKNPIITKTLRDYSQFPNKVLTSVRGGFKTFNAQELFLDDYFKRNRYFAIIRETDEELRQIMSSGFWDNNLICKSGYASHSYECRGNKLLINGRIVGVGVALKTYGKVRMSGFPVGQKLTASSRLILEQEIQDVENFAKRTPGGIKNVFFDEFEPIVPQLTPAVRCEAYKHICSTIFRFRPGFKVVWCANLPSNYSPMLEMLNFPNDPVKFGTFKSYTRVRHKPLAVWSHLNITEGWQELNRDSYVGLLTEGTNDDMFTTGLPFKNTDIKIANRKAEHRFILYNLTGAGENLTYWKTRSGTMHITARTKNTTFPTFAFELRECHDGVRLLPTEYATRLVAAYESGRIAFENTKVYESFMRLLPNKKARSKSQ